jgi:hypothetical protein
MATNLLIQLTYSIDMRCLWPQGSVTVTGVSIGNNTSVEYRGLSIGRTWAWPYALALALRHQGSARLGSCINNLELTIQIENPNVMIYYIFFYL